MIRYFMTLLLTALTLTGSASWFVGPTFDQLADQAIRTWRRSGAASAWHEGFVPRQPLTIMSQEVAAAFHPPPPAAEPGLPGGPTTAPPEPASAQPASWAAPETSEATAPLAILMATTSQGTAPASGAPTTPRYGPSAAPGLATTSAHSEAPTTPAGRAAMWEFGELSAIGPRTGLIRWNDGHVRRVPLIGAEEAEWELARAYPRSFCQRLPRRLARQYKQPGCDGTKITSALFTTVKVDTNRGPASVPAWRLSGKGLPGPIYQVAVSSTAIDPLLPELPDKSHSSHVAGFELGPDTTATIRFYRGACDQVKGVRVREEPDAVVVRPELRHWSGICNDMAIFEERTIILNAPLGNRPLLDAETGHPVPYGTR